MSDFVFDATPVSPAPPEAEAVVTNDGWFPDIDPAEVRRNSRVREGVTAPRLRRAIIDGIITVNRQLAGWKAAQVAAGHTTMAAVPAVEIDDTSQLLLLYSGAICAAAKVELVERYRDNDLTGAGQRQVEELDPALGELRRDMIHAVRDIRGEGRTVVELI